MTHSDHILRSLSHEIQKRLAFFKCGAFSINLQLKSYNAMIPMFVVTPVVTKILLLITGMSGNTGVTVTE